MCAWIARSPMSLNYVRHYLSLSRTHMHKGERESSGSSNRWVTYGQPWSNRSSPSSKMTFSHPWARESGGSKFTILPLDAEDRIETTRMSWISTSLHTHPLSPLIRAGALGIVNAIRLQAVGQARPSARGRARSPQDSEPRRVCPPDVLFENCHGRHGYYRRKPFRISSTIVGSSSPATGAQNATRSCSSRDSR